MRRRFPIALLALWAVTGSLAQNEVSFEDAVMMAGDGMIIRGTVLGSSTEGIDTPIPESAAGARPLLHTSWRILVDDCYYSADTCDGKNGRTIEVVAPTGGAVERGGRLVYEPIVTNSVRVAVATKLRTQGNYLLLLRPDASRGGYSIVPTHNACQEVSQQQVTLELRRQDLRSNGSKAGSYSTKQVPLEDLPQLIRRIHDDSPDSPRSLPSPPPR